MVSKVYVHPETAVRFGDSTQTPTPDTVITLTGLGVGIGRISARHDLGSTGAARSERYKWRFTCQFAATAPAIGETVELYLSTSDGSQPDGESGTADAAVLAGPLANMQFIGILTVEVATENVDMTASGYCDIPDPYVSVAVFNRTTAAFKTDVDTSFFTLTPIPLEAQ